uniref:Retinoid-inducible serine carboxypeptidase n=1 Tax=Panagrellus redivivus TaxID=6233 RepID=A0A7E4UPA4_PANRE
MTANRRPTIQRQLGTMANIQRNIHGNDSRLPLLKQSKLLSAALYIRFSSVLSAFVHQSCCIVFVRLIISHRTMLGAKMKLLILLAAFFAVATADGTVSTPKGVISYTEDWGYVDIRQNARTFWWLFAVKTEPNRPLILWLQGGPGSDSTGFGNIDELGPKDINQQDRNSTWLQLADLVFVDNPVGTGFSYVSNSNAFTKNVQQIGKDLVTWAKAFFTKHPEYATRKFYIVCESYGGKMTAEFGKQLQEAIEDGTVKATLGGVALGDSWISAMDFVNTWGQYLYSVSYLDDNQLTTVNAQAAKCQALVDGQKWYTATTCWSEMEDLIGILTDGVSWYNILKRGGTDDWSKFKSSDKSYRTSNKFKTLTAKERAFNRHLKPLQTESLDNLMNNEMRKKFGIIPDNIRFNAQSGQVFNSQWGDFMTPNYATVDTLLAKGVNVTVFNGQLDLICNTLGVELWLKRLTWPSLEKFQKATKSSFGNPSENNGQIFGYHKKYDNLNMYYILRAGHMVAHDAPWATLAVIKGILGL